MANNKALQILRSQKNPTTGDIKDEVLLDGQLFYSKNTKQLYIGDNVNYKNSNNKTTIEVTKPIGALGLTLKGKDNSIITSLGNVGSNDGELDQDTKLENSFIFGSGIKFNQNENSNNKLSTGVVAFGKGHNIKAGVENGYSFTHGLYNTNTHNSTNLLGKGLISRGDDQTIIGTYNESSSTSACAFIVGNGTGTADNDRSNAFEVKKIGGFNSYGNSEVDGSLTADKFIGNLEDSYITWGGPNRSSSDSVSMIDVSLVQELGANRFAFFKDRDIPIQGNGNTAFIKSIKLEYSDDGGKNWNVPTEYDTSTIRKGLFSTGTKFKINPKGNSEPTEIANMQCRVTLTPYDSIELDANGNIKIKNSDFYCILKKFVIYCSTAGSSGYKCLVGKRSLGNLISDIRKNIFKQEDATFESPAFEEISNASINGWPGWNTININNNDIVMKTFPLEGIYNDKLDNLIGQLRFTFSMDGQSKSDDKGLEIYKIQAFGPIAWGYMSQMANRGHIYDFDSDQNVAFPGDIKTAHSMICGDFKIKDADTTIAAISSSGAISGSSLSLSSTISVNNDSAKIASDGAISGTSLTLSGGGITKNGVISGSSLTTTGAISGSSLSLSGDGGIINAGAISGINSLNGVPITVEGNTTDGFKMTIFN